MPRKKQKGYTVKEKREAVQRIAGGAGIADVTRSLGYPHGTVHGWWMQRDKLLAYKGNAMRKTLGGQKREESFPFTPALVTFMKDERREENWLSTAGIIRFMWANYPDWIRAYMNDANKKSEESAQRALERMCQRTAARYGFSTQKPQPTKMPAELLELTKATFAIDFWRDYGNYDASEIYNVDETAVNYDMPPMRTWAIKGRKGSAKLTNLSKHSGRMTAVLTIRADGKKLPILFILLGKLGGEIDQAELPTYPPGHAYTVQERGWMDAVGWEFYVKNVLKYEIESHSLLLLDNFDSHVSEEGKRVVAEEACANVVPLSPNSTSACQPLDVGVMGPFKAKIRAQYISQSGLTAKEKRLNTIKATIAAWEGITEATVIRSFEKAIPRDPEVMV